MYWNKAWFVIGYAWFLNTGTVSAFSGITDYGARITAKDRVNSKGVPLKTIGAILAQDRANYHRFKKRDPQDSNDQEFTTAEKRALLTTKKITISPALRKKILAGKDVNIWVLVFRDYSIEVGEGLPRKDVS